MHSDSDFASYPDGLKKPQNLFTGVVLWPCGIPTVIQKKEERELPCRTWNEQFSKKERII